MKHIFNCLQCGAKLGTRNYTSRGKSITHFCQRCFSKPTDEHRCHGVTAKKEGCKCRKINGSDYCKVHKKRGIIDG